MMWQKEENKEEDNEGKGVEEEKKTKRRRRRRRRRSKNKSKNRKERWRKEGLRNSWWKVFFGSIRKKNEENHSCSISKFTLMRER